jgi:hypothetical protein
VAQAIGALCMAAEEHSHKTLAYFLSPLCMLVDFVALCDDGGRGGAESPSLIWETTVFIVYSGSTRDLEMSSRRHSRSYSAMNKITWFTRLESTS